MSENTAPYSLKDGIHVRPEYLEKSFGYSDGDENEKKMLEILQQTEDLSIKTEELEQHINSWVFEYHFSSLRHNLLRGFHLQAFENVLELGVGCGAITRQLGEQCKKITAVEGSFQRARIAAERCRELDNIHYYCDNFDQLDVSGKFDLITMIGSLEYAPVFVQGDDPVQRCLDQFANRLTDNGRLIVAIENQLGLKYFNGCGEDHMGDLFFGINDLYHQKTPITFGYQELKQKFFKAGFSKIEFLFPFPDYKLPRLIIREAAIYFEKLELGSIIGQCPGRDYNGRSVRHFAEQLCWSTLDRNNLIPHFANSFLVVASFDDPKPIYQEEWLIKIYNQSRKACYRTAGTFSPQGKKSCIVEKEYLHPEKQQASNFLQHTLTKENYIHGKQLGEFIAKGLLNKEWYAVYLEKLKSWIEYLRQFLLSEVDSDILQQEWQITAEIDRGWLPGHLVDCIPRNLIHDGKKWQYVDQEWVVQAPIPFLWVVFRGILNDISDHFPLAKYTSAFQECSIQDWITQTMEQTGYSIGITESQKTSVFALLLEWDIRFRCEASGQSEQQQRDSLHTLLEEQMGSLAQIMSLGARSHECMLTAQLKKIGETQYKLERSILDLQEELQRAQASKGYRAGEWIKHKIKTGKECLKWCWQECREKCLQNDFCGRVHKKKNKTTSQTPHHICMIVPSFDRVGGYERQAYSMCQAYQEMGKHPYIVTQNMGDLPTYEVREGIEIYRFYPMFNKHSGTYVRELEKLFAFDLAGQIDIVHCHAFDFISGWAIRIASQYGIPTLVKVATEQDVINYPQEIRIKTRGFSEALKNLLQSTRFISLNPNIKQELVAVGALEDRILSFPNGVDTKRFHPTTQNVKKKLKKKLGLSNRPYLVTYTGRFEERKRVMDLIHAWQRIHETFPQHHLLLIGDGEEQEACQEAVHSSGLTKRVTFVGEVQNVTEYLQVTDCYVFPSRLEGMPNVILEAMACGLPIITTKIPGIVEIIDDGESGLLVPPKNVSALANALTTMLSNPEIALQYGKTARKQAVQDYSFQVLGERYFQIYQELLDSNH